ncbi:MAG TPA: DNA-processing protein DprA [Egibacteraceae bacterium]|nr:DNA-processing protein DprA [Egibacteraceae bacterium]
MPTRSDSALASLLLTNRLVDTGAEPLTSRDYWQLLDQVDDPAVLLGCSVEALVGQFGLSRVIAERAAALLDAGTALAIELDRFEQQGLHAVTPFDAAYPGRLSRRLGTTAPPVLYTAGSLALLEHPGIAVVGSRTIADAGAVVATRVAQAAADRGDTVISGGAKGVDRLAMDAASQAGGTVVGVLADALDRRLRKPDVRRAIRRNELCLVTPYRPTAGFSVASAMARNKIIYALARVTLVVAADAGRGGTWEGAVEALRRGFGPVAVWSGEGAGDGNEALVSRGAHAVHDLERLFDEPPEIPVDPSSSCVWAYRRPRSASLVRREGQRVAEQVRSLRVRRVHAPGRAARPGPGGDRS